MLFGEDGQPSDRDLMTLAEQRIKRIDRTIAYLHGERIRLELILVDVKTRVERADNISAGEPGPITRLGKITRKGQ